jgi:hypothetical protein
MLDYWWIIEVMSNKGREKRIQKCMREVKLEGKMMSALTVVNDLDEEQCIWISCGMFIQAKQTCFFQKPSLANTGNELSEHPHFSKGGLRLPHTLFSHHPAPR